MVNKHVQTPIKQEVAVAQRQKNSSTCYFCGGLYSRNHKCPATEEQNSKCRKRCKICKSKAVHELETRSMAQEGMKFMIELVSNEEKVEKLYVLIRPTEQDSELPSKIDTSAKDKILSFKDFNRLVRMPALLPTANVLTSYTGAVGTGYSQSKSSIQEPKPSDSYLP